MKKNKQIILIGGAPTTGKSTMAEHLAKNLDLPWISTDQIRGIMRNVGKRSDNPKLFTPEGYDAERFLTEFTSEEIVRMEMEQADAMWSCVKTFIEEDFTWDKGFVVEGVDILPHLVSTDFAENDGIKAVFLIDEDQDRMRDVVFNRGLWGDADTYSDDVKEKEVEWVTLFGKKLKKEAVKHSYPVVEVTKDRDDLQGVLTALKIS